MAPSIPTQPPESFRAGDTVKFTVEHADYSGSDGWTLAYTVNGPVKKTATAATSGTSTTFTLSAADSSALSAGTYTWQITATKAATSERYTVYAGVVSVMADIAALATLQSKDEIELGYLNAEIAARLQSDHTEYTIEGRALKRESLTELQEMRDILRARIARRRRGGALGTVATHFPARNLG